MFNKYKCYGLLYFKIIQHKLEYLPDHPEPLIYSSDWLVVLIGWLVGCLIGCLSPSIFRLISGAYMKGFGSFQRFADGMRLHCYS